MATPTPGTRLGPYELQAPIGKGGMGEVWKARDTRVDRVVAIKFSQAGFGDRAEREARVIAGLNHPHICTLYDVGPTWLVMEFIEGEPVRGPMTPNKAVAYAAQILDALDAAHQKGIVHRDLKPGNILLTRQGIKLLDFGLAKQAAPLAETDATLTAALTKPGQILGTLQYMAPEQLHGIEADVRSDLFAFGCVLYELLTGKRAFDGASAASVIAAILERQPAPLDLSPPLLRIVSRCLAKNPDERFQTARDLKANLNWAIEEQPAPQRSKQLWAITAAVAVLAALAGWAIGHRNVRDSPTEAPVIRYSIAPPQNTSLRGGKISPDGRWIAILGIDSSGKKQLFVHAIDSTTFQPVAAATESDIFWSPDSRFIGFQQDGKLKKIAFSGGTPQTICDAPLVVGGAWNRSGIIIFGTGLGVSRVPATGGQVGSLTKADPSRGEIMHGFPAFLPDGRKFLFTIYGPKKENSGIYAASLDSPDSRIRISGDISNTEYVAGSNSDSAAGYLIFARGDTLMAQRFSPDRLQFRGEAIPVAEKVTRSASNFTVGFSTSQNGLLFINPTPSYSGDRLTWFDRSGHRLGTLAEPSLHFFPQISPDGKRLAVEQHDPETFSSDVWLYNVEGGGGVRFSFNSSKRPVWSPDGARIAYESANTAFYSQTVAGAENQELLLEGANFPDDGYRQPCEWSHDGRLLLYMQLDQPSGYDLWILPLQGQRKPMLFLRTPFNETCGTLSPDGRWVAYASDVSGRSEIYVQAFSTEGSGSPRQWQVSYHGGSWPKWKGRELFYLDAERNMVAVLVEAGASFQQGTPQMLFPTTIFTPDARFDVTADGKKFVIPAASVGDNPAPPEVLVNWMRRIPQ